MKIYVIHSSNFDYKNLLYIPLQESSLWRKHEFILPHFEKSEPIKSKELIKSRCDLIIAEVSHSSTWMGIELGWADAYNIPILCIHNKNFVIFS